MKVPVKFPMPVKIVIVVVLVLFAIWIGLKLAFPDIVTKRSLSVNGNYAEVVLDGAPLSGGTRILVWTNQVPHWRAFACTILETYHPQPIDLRWERNKLIVNHAYEQSEMRDAEGSCGSVAVTFLRTLKPYS